ncbi:MAG TPA: hypothetical protein VLW86_01190 [Syntrophorhabdales bacterium]|nr:hypothetical protein [Syntrophorhabdales bacterium]
MERLFVMLIAVLLLFGFSTVAFAAQTDGKVVTSSTPVSDNGSISMKQLARAENALYSGIGDAMVWGLVTLNTCPGSNGEQLSRLDELSGSENQTTPLTASSHGA